MDHQKKYVIGLVKTIDKNEAPYPHQAAQILVDDWDPSKSSDFRVYPIPFLEDGDRDYYDVALEYADLTRKNFENALRYRSILQAHRAGREISNQEKALVGSFLDSHLLVRKIRILCDHEFELPPR